MFDAIREVHLATGHGARDVMHDRAKQQFVNLTKEVLQLYSDLCEECQVNCFSVSSFLDQGLHSNGKLWGYPLLLVDTHSFPFHYLEILFMVMWLLSFLPSIILHLYSSSGINLKGDAKVIIIPLFNSGKEEQQDTPCVCGHQTNGEQHIELPMSGTGMPDFSLFDFTKKIYAFILKL